MPTDKNQQRLKHMPKAFAEHLTKDVIFEMGNLTFSRQEMIDLLSCANFIAAARLMKALKKLGVTSGAQLKKIEPWDLYRLRGVGHTQVFVATCLLDYLGYDVDKWWSWEKPKTRGHEV